jgi:hypothetical protein
VPNTDCEGPATGAVVIESPSEVSVDVVAGIVFLIGAGLVETRSGAWIRCSRTAYR